MQSQSQSTNLGDPDATTPQNPGALESILKNYQPQDQAYDEMFDGQGMIRQSCREFHQHVPIQGPKSFAKRWAHSQRLIYQNAIAYSPYGDPQHDVRPWQLDALPVLLTETEWQAIGQGLVQRAKLLNHVLSDLYGPQTLIRKGVLPAELLHLHPGFQLPFHQSDVVQGQFLQMYASDLGRAPNGQWWVLADRTESPSGIGFALENRVVISRMLPEAFRALKVRRLASYFVELRRTLQRLAKTHKDNPRIVILSQGPQHANYFEDAYLSRYLGVTLVEGSDLAVRGNAVWLKTLAGLLQVDVIIRRPNSLACDPLDVPGTFPSGISGLLEAVRAGNVVVTNSLGSGLVESPVFMAFMPRLCKALFDEELRLPGVATWWCGEPKSFDYVINHLDRLIVKKAFRQRGADHYDHRELNSLPQDQLADRIRSNPSQFVAQEKVIRSMSPQWNQGDLSSVHLSLRSFLVATEDSFEVMQGALTRTSSQPEPIEASLLSGEGSKDTWITSDRAVESITLLPKREAMFPLKRSGAELPSRVAENIFWLGRQLERVDATARLIWTIASRLTSERSGKLNELPLLLRAVAEQGQIEPGFVVDGIKESLPAIENALPELVFDREQPNSLRSLIDGLFRNAQTVRDRLSADNWRVIVRIDQQFRKPEGSSIDLTDLLNLTNDLTIDLAAVSGIVNESMTRTHAFRFLDIGRRLERAWQNVLLLKNCFVGNSSVTRELLESVLEVENSIMTYRSRYLASLQLTAVLDMLLTDETNPRSVLYQLTELESTMNELPRDHSRRFFERDRQLILTMLHSVRLFQIEQIQSEADLHSKLEFSNLLEQLEQTLPQLSDALSHRYMVHAGPNQQLTDVN